MSFPSQFTLNAWTGPDGQASSQAGANVAGWGFTAQMQPVSQLLVAPEALDLRDWQNEEIGWGLVLPENENISEADRAVAADAPEPIRKLLAARENAPVFRYRTDLQNRFLRRYYLDRSSQDIQISSAGQRGIGVGRLPYYLLIVGSPEKIPWRLQYVLNQPCFVGRLDLDEGGLKHYIDALLKDWADAGVEPDHPVVWTVDHGHPDITWLMRHAIAEPVGQKLREDADIGDKATILAGSTATADALTEALIAQKPALIITTSHGMTGPLDDPGLMAQQLGLLVDDEGVTLHPHHLLQKWQPNGAIWYAHACCSAGSDGETSYKGLLTEGSTADRVLEAVAQIGAKIAPLPTELLGAEKPLRAFVGQVEPTFDWTIRDPDTGQVLTTTLQNALYNRMYRKHPEPVGMAFQECFRHVGELFSQWQQALRNINSPSQATRDAARVAALRTQLAALDRQSLVILGDPTACLPPLQSPLE